MNDTGPAVPDVDQAYGSSATEARPADAPGAPQGDTGREALRARLTRQFQAWLDDALADEAPPRGVPDDLIADADADASIQSDLYSLFAAVTALTGEVRLQGRAFKQLTDSLSPLADAPTLLRQLEAAQRESTQAIERVTADSPDDDDDDGLAASTHQVCDVLIDMYDRLDRGHQTCASGIAAMRASQPAGLFWRLAGGPRWAERAASNLDALRDAAAITLARLQAAMHEFGMQRIGAAGEPFDPRVMSAVEVRAPDDDAADNAPGTVLEVVRSGYALNGRLVAVARVAVVSAGPSPDNHTA